MKLFEELKWRGFIKDVSSEELAEKLLNEESIFFYCGFDPSAGSLQMGNFVQVIRILLLQKYGHRPIVLVGGATGLIGDPKQSGERKLLTLEESLKNAENIKTQLSKYIRFDDVDGAIIVNNYDWISKIDVITFLRDYGKNFNINYMLAKDTVQNRIDTGISYTEFSYMILQSIDFLHLYEKYNCRLQFGGSDQWGNITAGLELIRKTLGENELAIGISSPLLLKSDGTKFGKSESGALWLDEKLTSPYELYQYFINTADEDVIRYLKSLTILDPADIIEIEQKSKENPEQRIAQKILGKEVVQLVHGEHAYERALKISDYLFSGEVKNLTVDEIEQSFKGVPTLEINESKNIIDLLIESNAATSKREAREFVESGAITINGDKIIDISYEVSKSITLYNKYIIIRRGKKKYYLVVFM